MNFIKLVRREFIPELDIQRINVRGDRARFVMCGHGDGKAGAAGRDLVIRAKCVNKRVKPTLFVDGQIAAVIDSRPCVEVIVRALYGAPRFD